MQSVARTAAASLVLWMAIAAAPRESCATFSICAWDPETGELGVAVQSRAFNVSMAVPWALAGVGAVATQASTNESFGPCALALLARGLDPAAVIDSLLSRDPGRDHRQVGIVDARGRSASVTGTRCLAWAGGRSGPGYTIQGNILASEEIVAAMQRVFLETPGELSWRLLQALVAAQEKGGDRRGQQSAALLVVRPSPTYPEYNTRYVQLAVDDHPEPIREILRTYAILEGADLAEAHLRFAEEYDAAGDSASARRGAPWIWSQRASRSSTRSRRSISAGESATRRSASGSARSPSIRRAST